LRPGRAWLALCPRRDGTAVRLLGVGVRLVSADTDPQADLFADTGDLDAN
jgi:hypothetical protein